VLRFDTFLGLLLRAVLPSIRVKVGIIKVVLQGLSQARGGVFYLWYLKPRNMLVGSSDAEKLHDLISLLCKGLVQ